MEYVGFIFGIFGLLAFVELSSLKQRIRTLEEQLATTKGTPAHEARRDLQRLAVSCVGKQVVLELKEDCEDTDIISCGNTKHGSNTILDADHEWLLVRVDTPKGAKEKLLRLSSLQRISIVRE